MVAASGVLTVPWLKVDDGFAAHPKLERLQAHCGTNHPAFGYAIAVWTLMGTDCAARLTDGEFTRERARRVVLLPAYAVDEGIEALEATGYIDVQDADRWKFHDWSHYQPSREEVEAKRADISRKRSEAGKRGNEARWGADRKIANGVVTPSQNENRPVANPSDRRVAAAVPVRKSDNYAENRGVAKSQTVSPRPVPTRPYQKPEENTTCSRSGGGSDVPIPPRSMNPDNQSPSNDRGAPVPNAKSPDAQLNLLGDPATPSRAPSDAHSGALPAPNASVPAATTPAPRKRASRAAAKPKAVKEKAPEEPMPFTVMDAVQAVEAAANGRFVVGHTNEWSRGTYTNITAKVKQFPDLARWTLVGEWLASRGLSRSGPLTANWAGSNDLNTQMIASRDWHEKGRKPQGYSAIPVIAKTSPHEGYVPSNANIEAWEEATAQKAAMGRGMFGSGAGRPIEEDPRGYDCDSDDFPVAGNVRAIR